MKYLQLLLHTKAPSNTRLLDIALTLSIIPHLFVAKFFMLLYVAIALLFILRDISRQYILMVLGLLLIGLSFFSSYNFSDFSRMQFFVSLVSSLLIFAVTLQKLTKVTNIYLQISPILLMVLSFFFFNSIFMLLYSLTTLFTFTLLYIWSRMDTTLGEVLNFTAKLFLLSLPSVAIMFLVFPRISIEKADFGFRADTYVESGYNGTMKVSSDAVRLSNEIVMEVLFEDNNISNSQLYFRGTTLSKQKGLEWIKNPTLKSKDRVTNAKNIKEYEVTIYPHAKNWVYALDIPLNEPKKTQRGRDYTLSSDKPLYQKKKYLLKSALNYTLHTDNLSSMLKVDKDSNEKTFNALEYIREQNLSTYEKANKLLNFFENQNLSYSLKPIGVDLNDFTDSFLLKSKNGYCVHFASAFASCARMLGIPSRIVTGFKADRKNMINNYLLVKASDAHAWVELYFEDEGWLRFDPTTTAIKNTNQTQVQEQIIQEENPYFTKINHYFLYTKYMINKWILDYDRVKQMEILKQLLNDTLYLLKFVFSFLALIIVSIVLFFLLKASRCKDRLMCEMQKLFKIFKKYDISKNPHESMQEFLTATEMQLDIDLKNINKLYHELKYQKEVDKVVFDSLKKEIRKVKLHLTNQREGLA
jgi:protein-glutamine gamma-glutamyltransferase